MARDEGIHDLGEHPTLRTINEALTEVGTAAIMEKVKALLAGGYSHDEVNTILRERILPAFRRWLAEQVQLILEAINASVHTKH